MTTRLLFFLVVSLVLALQTAQGADTTRTIPATKQVMPLLFDKVAPLPGALAVSATGNIAAHIGINGDVVVWNMSDGNLLETITAGDKKPSAIALSPDGALIAIGYFDSRLIIRSRAEKKPLRQFYGHSGGISAIAFSSDSKMLASGGDDATTQLWEVSSGRRLNIFDSMYNGDISSGSGIPVSVGFAGNGKILLVNEWYSRHYDVDRRSTVWSVQDGIEISTRDVASPNSDSTMRAGHALGGNGWLLAYTGDWLSDNTGLMVERLDRCDSPRQLPSGGFADTVAADPLGRWVAATDAEKITFFGMGSVKKSHDFTIPAKAIALVPHPDGRSLFALMIADTTRNGDDRFIFGRDAETVTGGALYRFPVPKSLLESPPLSVKEDANHCPPTKAARLQQDYKVPEKPLVLVVIATQLGGAHRGFPRELYFGNQGNLFTLYEGSSGISVVEFSLQTKRPLRDRIASNADRDLIVRMREGWAEAKDSLIDLVTGQSFSNISNSDDKNTYLHRSVVSDPDTGAIYRARKGYVECYASDGQRLKDVKVNGTVVALVARNGRLAALYEGGEVQVWQLEPRGKSKTYKSGVKIDDTQEPHDLALSADGRYLRVAFAGPDVPTSYAVYRLGKSSPVGDGELLAPFPLRANRGVVPGARPNRLAVWDYDKGEIIARLPRHRSRNNEGGYVPLLAAISEDGRLVASAARDGLVRIWDIDAHMLVGEGRAGSEVTAMAFDSTGENLAIGRQDGQVVVFQVPAPR